MLEFAPDNFGDFCLSKWPTTHVQPAESILKTFRSVITVWPQKSHETTSATAASVTVEAGEVRLQPRPGVRLIG